MSEEADLGEAVLVLSTDGSGLRMGIDEAQVAANAMQVKLDEMQAHIQASFAQKFEHAGIYLFSRQLLNTVGLGQLAQHAFAAIDIGMKTLAESFGIAATTLGPLLLALGVGITVYELYEKKHKEHVESLEKEIEADKKAIDSTIDYNEKLGKLLTTVGYMTPALHDMADAEKKLLAIQSGNLAGVTAKQIEAARAQIRSDQEQIDSKEKLIASYVGWISAQTAIGMVTESYTKTANKLSEQVRALNTDIDTQNEIMKRGRADIEARAHGFKDAADEAEHLAKAAEHQAEAAKKAEAASEAWNKKIDEQIAKEEAVGKAWDASSKKAQDAITRLGTVTKEVEQDGAAATTSAYDKRKAEIEKYRIAKQAEIDRMHDEAVANARTGDQILAANRQYAAANEALTTTVAQKTFENYNAIGQYAAQIGKSIQNSFSTAAAQAILAHRGMHDSIIAISAQIKQQVIADAISAGIEYVVQAAKGVFMHDAIAVAAKASAAAQIAANAAVITSNQAKVASVVELTTALTAAGVAATALDVALAAAV